MLLVSYLLILLLSRPTDHGVERMRDAELFQEAWGVQQVTEFLGTKADVSNVFLSPRPAVKPHVCGSVLLDFPPWGKGNRSFVVNGTTGNVYVDDDSLFFNRLWAIVCTDRRIVE